MTANDDNTAGIIPGTIRDPITAANILRVNADGSINATIAGVVGSSISQPGGRLTLVTATPVMTSDQTAKSTVFYDTFVGNSVPIYNGTSMAPLIIGSDEISLVLNATDNTSTNLYDIFAFSSSGTLTLGTGPAWTNSTTRSAAISLKNGIWTNTGSITLRANGSSLGSIAANQATYLGTIYCTANGQTGMAFKPAGASGGSNNILGVFNAYNRVLVVSQCRDTTNSWTYNSTSWRSANNSTSNRISYIDGLAQSSVDASYQVDANATGGSGVRAGVSFNSTSTPENFGNNDATTGVTVVGTGSFAPALGFNFVQAVEAIGNGSSAATYTSFGVLQWLRLSMMM